MVENPANPKPHRSLGKGRAHWYPYYAGYSPEFVSDMLIKLDLGREAFVLDPWNGSGTTTTICAMNGIASAGFDINPAMVAVAKARLLGCNISASLAPLLDVVLERAQACPVRSDVREPLRAWFSKNTASRIRALERTVQNTLVGTRSDDDASLPNVDEFSSLAAFFYVMIFRLVRSSIRKSTNPTWVKAYTEESKKITLTWSDICTKLELDLAQIQLVDAVAESNAANATALLTIGDSRTIPLTEESVDAVITSPPYCTRIDYAVSTRVELAVLGVALDEKFATLRRNMLGTVVTDKSSLAGLINVTSDHCKAVLADVAMHPSKASSGYYLHFFADYFSKLSQSIAQLARVIKPGGTATFVVQDSAYKEIHIDLARIVGETFISNGFGEEFRWNYRCSKNMRNIHSIARSHNRAWSPTESTIVFRKK